MANKLNSLERFKAQFPDAREMSTGGNCESLEIPVGDGLAMITAVDEPTLPLPTDETISLGFYSRHGEFLDGLDRAVTWDEAAAMISARKGAPKVRQ